MFAKIDFCSDYHQLRVKEESIFKIAFKTRYGYYEFVMRHFQLTNTPAAFMSLVNTMFHRYLDKFVIVLMDNVLVYFDNNSDH